MIVPELFASSIESQQSTRSSLSHRRFGDLLGRKLVAVLFDPHCCAFLSAYGHDTGPLIRFSPPPNIAIFARFNDFRRRHTNNSPQIRMANDQNISPSEHDWEWWSRFLQREYYASKEEVRTWKRTVKRVVEQTGLERGESLLDLGSGSGELIFGLTRAGYTATGVELHELLAEECRRLASEEKLTSRFITSDMFEFSPEHTYDVIVSINTSFGYGSEVQNRSLISNVFSWLRPGGRFCLDTVIADEAEGFGLWKDDLAGGTLHVENEWDEEASLMISRPWWVSGEGTICTVEEPERVRIYRIDEIEEMLDAAGFRHRRLPKGSGRRTSNESGPNSTATWLATRPIS